MGARTIWVVKKDKTMKRKILILGIVVLTIFTLYAGQARAVLTDLIPCNGDAIDHNGNCLPSGGSGIPVKFQTLDSIIALIFNTIITISGVIFLIMLLIGGIQYLTGAGNEETTGKAKKMMIDAIVGLIIVLASWAIGTWILGRLGGTATTTAPASTPGSTSTTTPPPSSTPSSTPTTSPTSYDWNI